jgi:hypothetical protein
MTLNDNARVWIYQSTRFLNTSETQALQQLAAEFVNDWAAHGRPLVAEASVQHGLFLVLAVDETAAGASGCSIDKSVAFVRAMQDRFDINLLDRMTFAYREATGSIALAPRNVFSQLYDLNIINDETQVFDPLVTTVGHFRTHFEKPLALSWHRRMVKIAV